MERENEIRAIAYQVWEGEGRPEGRGLDHWLKAEAIWEARQRKQASVPQSPLPGQSPRGPKRRSKNNARHSSMAKAR